jgi:hypothetical protein
MPWVLTTNDQQNWHIGYHSLNDESGSLKTPTATLRNGYLEINKTLLPFYRPNIQVRTTQG